MIFRTAMNITSTLRLLKNFTAYMAKPLFDHPEWGTKELEVNSALTPEIFSKLLSEQGISKMNQRIDRLKQSPVEVTDDRIEFLAEKNAKQNHELKDILQKKVSSIQMLFVFVFFLVIHYIIYCIIRYPCESFSVARIIMSLSP